MVLMTVCVLLGFVLLPGCVSTTLQEVRESDTGIASHESIAILGRRHQTRNETESYFVECVAEKTSSGSDAVQVVTDQQFVDAFFPWFEPRTAPSDVADMKSLVMNPKVEQRIEEMGVRYVVWIEGSTQRTEQAGTVQCAVATGGVPACFGFLSWEAGSNYEATIWDVRKGVSAGKVSSEAKGTSFVPAIIVPLPFIARTQSHACATMSEQLKEFIAQ